MKSLFCTSVVGLLGSVGSVVGSVGTLVVAFMTAGVVTGLGIEVTVVVSASISSGSRIADPLGCVTIVKIFATGTG